MIFKALDYRTNLPIKLEVKGDKIYDISVCDERIDSNFFIAPGLVDIQLNGFQGIDLNQLGLKMTDVKTLAQVLFRNGVTTFFPTIITNAVNATHDLLAVIAAACDAYPEIDKCIGGIHLEGPFLSAEEGPRGAHRKEFIQAPDWELFSYWQKAAKGRIKIITLAPEWAGSSIFIKRCVASGVVVSIGHTAANPEQIKAAIEAGARMSTHLGNASHAMLPRHINYIYEQLASEELWSTVIADGFHLPDSLLKICIKAKPNQTILISDATSFAGLPSGLYTGHIGGEVELNSEGKLHVKNNPNLLAGSAQSVMWGVNQLVKKQILSLQEAWNMASLKPSAFFNGNATNALEVGNQADFVIFKKEHNNLKVIKTIKAGELVFEN
ncbi:N-acetylglucosamine-6-phosphate deacetylase [Formosa algae]|uniref:N-acetylglucosamine-6-phosphate deacetylase n=1 Tax=Formosa algae TaxID=225843 RepID=A0A9X0YKV7_9FLAO|nr:amidohydrolase family protein [Formosa algae]MBP1838791.1 N-acetylglucosamine-6-phosphate deacetylase [Formosa algae]MDQ0335291.1 N-acetylglucosamine-6-phosphate deacetylase [Formosa algae]OEI80449.1 N-acetylglucosamine-6-phosphate deacetylase [Formosa algae]